MSDITAGGSTDSGVGGGGALEHPYLGGAAGGGGEPTMTVVHLSGVWSDSGHRWGKPYIARCESCRWEGEPRAEPWEARADEEHHLGRFDEDLDYHRGAHAAVVFAVEAEQQAIRDTNDEAEQQQADALATALARIDALEARERERAAAEVAPEAP